jgi:hypothetical protein
MTSEMDSWVQHDGVTAHNVKINSLLQELPYLRVYKPHFFDKNLPCKIGVRLYTEHCPFHDWARDVGIVCCETPSRDR